MKMNALKMKKMLFNCVLQDTAGSKGLNTLALNPATFDIFTPKKGDVCSS